MNKGSLQKHRPVAYDRNNFRIYVGDEVRLNNSAHGPYTVDAIVGTARAAVLSLRSGFFKHPQYIYPSIVEVLPSIALTRGLRKDNSGIGRVLSDGTKTERDTTRQQG